jgi:hypothetical protein
VVSGIHTGYSRACSIRFQADYEVFQDNKVVLRGYDGLHTLGVFLLVALRTRCADGWPAAKVQCLLLKRGKVGVESHFAAQCI